MEKNRSLSMQEGGSPKSSKRPPKLTTKRASLQNMRADGNHETPQMSKEQLEQKLQPLQKDEGVILIFDSNEHDFVQYASLNYLIDSMVEENSLPEKRSLTDTVLLTHTSYTTSLDVMERLITIFEQSFYKCTADVGTIHSQKAAKVIEILKRWRYLKVDWSHSDVKKKISLFFLNLEEKISSNANDGFVKTDTHTNLLKQLRNIVQSGALERSASMLGSARAKEQRNEKLIMSQRLTKKKSRLSLTLSPRRNHKLVFKDIDPLLLARHLTALDWTLFSRISPKELIHKAWTKQDEGLAPNVNQLIAQFNKISGWITSEIIQTIPKSRVEALESCINLIKHFLDLQNYHGIWTVLSALNRQSIRQLYAWKNVSRKNMALFHEVEALTDNAGNYRVYRERIKAAKPPLIPYEVVLLGDLSFIDDTVDTKDGYINLGKMELLGETLYAIREYQSVPYEDEVAENIQLHDMIEKSVIMDQNTMQVFGVNTAGAKYSLDDLSDNSSSSKEEEEPVVPRSMSMRNLKVVRRLYSDAKDDKKMASSSSVTSTSSTLNNGSANAPPKGRKDMRRAHSIANAFA